MEKQAQPRKGEGQPLPALTSVKCSMGEGGARRAERQGWWLSIGWSKRGRLSCVHGPEGRHLEVAWPAGVS